jgi:hypothetical protein
MDGHQRRIWRRMIDQIDQYRAGELSLSRLVTNLEGLLDASETRNANLLGVLEQAGDERE